MKADEVAMQISDFSWLQRRMNAVWQFIRLIRKMEYYTNCKQSALYDAHTLLLKYRHRRLGYMLGFVIGPNVFGPGLSIAHIGTIIINGNAKVGANCHLHSCVHIGTAPGITPKVPRIGDNVFIGPNVSIFGDIEIADGIAIGANSVVNKSFIEPNITIAGVPARKISDKGSKLLYHRATELITQS